MKKWMENSLSLLLNGFFLKKLQLFRRKEDYKEKKKKTT